jgi:hypothetical protein
MKKRTYTIIAVVVLVLVVAALAAFWYFFMRPATPTTGTTTSPTTGYSPFGRPSTGNNIGTTTTNNNNGNNGTPTIVKVPALRLLSATPIGGYGASTTASTTVVRWIDRGRGNILQATEDSLDIQTLSNTLLPKMYESVWGKGINSLIGSILGDDDATISTIYAALLPQGNVNQKTGTSTPANTNNSSLAPYKLQGKNLPAGIVSYATSPKKDRVFLFAVQGGQGIGYVAPFNGGTATEIFNTPVTQVNVDWPEANTISITTKGSATDNGYLYFVSPTTGTWKKILGPLPGMSAIVSHDARYAIVSAAGNANNVVTYIYSIATSTATDAIIRTLADKCVWGNFYKDMVYCAVPFQPVSGTYPDDWYKGTLSTVDKIWQENAATGEVHLISSVFEQARTNIDAFNLGLDDKDNYLFFMNKLDLSFWSLDLVDSNQ